jgi:hypothetical protein
LVARPDTSTSWSPSAVPAGMATVPAKPPSGPVCRGASAQAAVVGRARRGRRLGRSPGPGG